MPRRLVYSYVSDFQSSISLIYPDEEAASSSETFVTMYQAILGYVEFSIHLHRCENQKFHIYFYFRKFKIRKSPKMIKFSKIKFRLL
jgi:hypothetical protein